MCNKPKTDNSAQKFQQRQAEQARIDEQRRQQMIDYGLDSIRAIFEGGDRYGDFASFLGGTGRPISPDVKGFGAPGGDNPYTRALGYTPSGTAAPAQQTSQQAAPAPAPGFSAGGLSFGGGDQSAQADEDRRGFNLAGFLDARKPQPVTFTPPQASGEVITSPGFGGLVDRRRQAQLDFQLPQLNDRFTDARDDLAFALARAGLSNSTVAAGRQADLGQDFQLQDAQLRSGIEQDVSNLRSRLASARSSLEAQLRASADPSAAINDALATATRFFQEQPPATTIGDVFAGAAEGIGQAYNTYQSGRISDRLNNILASGATGRSGSGRVVA